MGLYSGSEYSRDWSTVWGGGIMARKGVWRGGVEKSSEVIMPRTGVHWRREYRRRGWEYIVGGIMARCMARSGIE